MITVFDFDDYKKFTKARLAELPKGGHGEMKKIALALSMHTTQISQVFNGDSKNLSIEQACAFCEYLGLSDLESDYFLSLVHLARSGTHKSQQTFRKQLERMRVRAQEVSHRIPDRKKLTPTDQAHFYSQWYYSAVRLLTSIPEFQTLNAIAQKLSFSKAKTREILDFLVSVGLCVEKEGRYEMGPTNTHIEASSPLVGRHHTNWRLQAVERYDRMSETDLSFTAPITLSREDFQKVRTMILELIEKTAKTVKSSPSEELAFLNLDWIRF